MADYAPPEKSRPHGLPDAAKVSPIYEINYAHLEGLAQGHDDHATAVSTWAGADPDIAQRLLLTHGKVAYQTYLNVVAFNEQRQTQATNFATRNTNTAVGLRRVVTDTRQIDEANGASFGAQGTTAV